MLFRSLDILNDYEEASGQKINKTKTTLFFSKATDVALKNNIKEAWEFRKLCNTKNIWVYLHLLGKGKNQVSTTSRRGYEEKFKDGKGNYSHKQEGKC